MVDTIPLVDMGVDSLVAVEMRSWFLKELAVDVPVMKILGGASVADLVSVVVVKLPQELLARLDPEGKYKATTYDAPTGSEKADAEKAQSESGDALSDNSSDSGIQADIEQPVKHKKVVAAISMEAAPESVAA